MHSKWSEQHDLMCSIDTTGKQTIEGFLGFLKFCCSWANCRLKMKFADTIISVIGEM